jgi:hypothetical protein
MSRDNTLIVSLWFARGFLEAFECEKMRAVSKEIATGKPTTRRYTFWFVLTRMSGDERTKTYVTRRRDEGKNTAEIVRCLKRYIARERFKHLPRTA